MVWDNNKSNFETRTDVPDGQKITAAEWNDMVSDQKSRITGVDVENDGTLVLETSTVNFATNLSVSDDGDGTVTVDATDTNLTNEEVEDIVGALITGGSNVTVNYDDANDTLTINSTDTTTDVSDGGTTVVSQVTDINFGDDVTVTDDGDGTVTVDNTGGTSVTASVTGDGTTTLFTLPHSHGTTPEAAQIQPESTTAADANFWVADKRSSELDVEYKTAPGSDTLAYNLWLAGEVAIPDSGVARYEFEQDVADSWNGYDATDNTSAGYTTDSALGTYAKSFDGDDDYLDIPSLPITLGGGGDFSFSLWFRSTSNSDQTFIRLGDKAAVIRTNDDGSGNYVIFVQTDASTAPITGTTHLTDGTYRMVTVTYNSSTDEFTGFVNDTSEDTGAESTWPSDGNIQIGERGDGLWYLNGDIDDARIFDKELTATEVSSLYNTGSISG